MSRGSCGLKKTLRRSRDSWHQNGLKDATLTIRCYGGKGRGERGNLRREIIATKDDRRGRHRHWLIIYIDDNAPWIIDSDLLPSETFCGNLCVLRHPPPPRLQMKTLSSARMANYAGKFSRKADKRFVVCIVYKSMGTGMIFFVISSLSNGWFTLFGPWGGGGG